MEQETTETPELLPLNDQQELFCREYIVDFNAAKAAIRSGYSENSARSIGCQLLTKLNIKARIDELKEDIFATIGITQARIYRELLSIATYDVRKIFNVDGGLKSIREIDDETAAAIAGIESYDEHEPDSGMLLGTLRKIKTADKLNAISQIVKIGGWAAPTKVAQTDAAGNDVATMTFTVVKPVEE
jgi:phage terminase small subunit